MHRTRAKQVPPFKYHTQCWIKKPCISWYCATQYNTIAKIQERRGTNDKHGERTYEQLTHTTLTELFQLDRIEQLTSRLEAAASGMLAESLEDVEDLFCTSVGVFDDRDCRLQWSVEVLQG